ncbi:MAG: BPL-N domain-containing protein [Planctomycetota bacterium]|jgi:predicted deacylase/glutamine amidotransferase-like uncharacterized protein
MEWMRRLRPLAAALALAAFASPARGAGLTRSSGLIAAGSPWETPYYVTDSGQPGPAVLLTAGIHGNETAGPEAAQQIRHWPVRRGRLIVVPAANAPGLAAGKRYLPDEPEATRDPNRNFPVAGGADAPRTALCRALWDFAVQQRPTWHVDLHEGYGFRAGGSKSTGSSVIHFRGSPAAALVPKLLEAANTRVTEEGRRFVPLGPPAKGSLTRATAERLGAQSLILETTTHETVDGKRRDRLLAIRVRQHRLMVHALLTELGMAACVPERMVPPRPAGGRSGPVRVAIYSGPGTGNGALTTVRAVLARQEGLARAVPVGPGDIHAGALGQFDVVVFPGGSGSKQAAGIGAEGREAVQRFVRDGGGYIGICAGAYLASWRYTWGLKILDARTVDSKHWNRGNGMVKVELTARGRAVLGGPERPMDIYYAQGPLLARAEVASLPDFEVLAYYRTEIAKNGAPNGVMVDTPAVVAAPFGRGRVLCLSPHFEKASSEKGADALVRRAILWTAGRAAGSARAVEGRKAG